MTKKESNNLVILDGVLKKKSITQNEKGYWEGFIILSVSERAYNEADNSYELVDRDQTVKNLWGNIAEKLKDAQVGQTVCLIGKQIMKESTKDGNTFRNPRLHYIQVQYWGTQQEEAAEEVDDDTNF